MEDKTNPAVDIAVLREQVDSLLKWRDTFTSQILHRLESLEKEVRDALTGRPTWGTLALITFLSSAVVGLLVNTFK